MTNDQMVDLFDEVGEQFELSRDLGATHNRCHGAFGFAKGALQSLQLSLHEATCAGRQETGEPFG